MSPAGEPDEVYVRARHALLDALDALGAQVPGVVLVGAQAIYLRVGEGGVALAPYTADAYLCVNPGILLLIPKLEVAMKGAGLREFKNPGSWRGDSEISIDLMVPEALAGGGRARRGVRIPPHDPRAARRTVGIHAALIDNDPMEIRALNLSDQRVHEIAVAGPLALLVAKLHKLGERGQELRHDRLNDKDALDVLRLLRGATREDMAHRINPILRDEAARRELGGAMTFLDQMFSRPEAVGSKMAARAMGDLEDGSTVTASCAALSVELLGAIRPLF